MDADRFLEAWRERDRLEAVRWGAARARARAAVPEVVALLVHSGAGRVWLIGSLPRGTWRDGSDVDFMVEGLPNDVSALQIAEEASDRTGYAVDVVRAEALRPRWRSLHERWGELLHG